MALIPRERQVHVRLFIGRPDGETWVDVAPWLARVTVERGDVTNVGVGGNDGVVQMLRFDLHNDGTMMPTWKDTVSQDSSYIVGKESDVVGDESESASKLIDLLLGTKVEYRRDSFSPHDKNSAWNRDENNQYAPLLWPYREVVLAVAITPKGKEPTLNDWTFPFEGFLGENIGVRQNGSIISVQAKSKAKLLQDTLIETEQEYGSNDEDVSVESVMQAIIDNNLGPGVVSLYCPVPSQAYVRPYVVKDKTVWDALQELAGKVGWFLGDRWDPQTKAAPAHFLWNPPSTRMPLQRISALAGRVISISKSLTRRIGTIATPSLLSIGMKNWRERTPLRCHRNLSQAWCGVLPSSVLVRRT